MGTGDEDKPGEMTGEQLAREAHRLAMEMVRDCCENNGLLQGRLAMLIRQLACVDFIGIYIGNAIVDSNLSTAEIETIFYDLDIALRRGSSRIAAAKRRANQHDSDERKDTHDA